MTGSFQVTGAAQGGACQSCSCSVRNFGSHGKKRIGFYVGQEGVEEKKSGITGLQ